MAWRAVAHFLRVGNANPQRESYFQWRNTARRFFFFLYTNKCKSLFYSYHPWLISFAFHSFVAKRVTRFDIWYLCEWATLYICIYILAKRGINYSDSAARSLICIAFLSVQFQVTLARIKSFFLCRMNKGDTPCSVFTPLYIFVGCVKRIPRRGVVDIISRRARSGKISSTSRSLNVGERKWLKVDGAGGVRKFFRSPASCPFTLFCPGTRLLCRTRGFNELYGQQITALSHSRAFISGSAFHSRVHTEFTAKSGCSVHVSRLTPNAFVTLHK